MNKSKRKKQQYQKSKSDKFDRPDVDDLDTPVTRMDDACYSHDPLTQYLNRQRYHETYLADIRGSERIDRRIIEELS